MLICLLALPVCAYADEPTPAPDNTKNEDSVDGQITIGGSGVHLNTRSSKFGEYNGLLDSTGFFVGDADLLIHSDSKYFSLLAEDIGLENRTINMELGEYGDYKFFAELDQQPHYLSTTSKSYFDGIGGTVLTNPTGFATGANAAGVTFGKINDVDLKLDSVNGTLGFARTFGEDKEKEFKFTFHRNERNGIQSLGGTFGTTGGNTRSVVIPELVDQVTNEIRTSLAFNGQDKQFQLDYFFSSYNNKVKSITFDSPYTPVAGTIAAKGLISRAPDNQYHKLSLSSGWKLSPTTRLSSIVEYGVSKQDTNLLAFSLDAAGSDRSLLPRQTAGAEIQTVHVNLNLTAKPFKKLGVNLKYRHYETINETEQSEFLYFRNDTNAAVGAATNRALTNLPYDYKQDQATLDLNYSLFKGTQLKLGFESELYQRDFREVEATVENTVQTRLKSSYFSFVDMSFWGSYANRVADSYDPTRPFTARHSDACLLGACAGSFDSNPDLRRVDVANRHRSKFGSAFTFFPTDKLIVGMNYNFLEDDFVNSTRGVQFDKNQDVTLDLSYTPTQTTSYTAYYTFNRRQAQQDNRSFSNAAQAQDTSRDWRADHDDLSNTVGFEVKRKAMDKKLDLTANYVYTKSLTHITFATGSALAAGVDAPDLLTERHRLGLTGKYTVNPNLTIGLNYLYENYRTKDFSTIGISASSGEVAQSILLSAIDRNYEAQVGMLFAVYTFNTPQ